MVTEKELEKKYNKNELINCVFKTPQRSDSGSAGYDFFSPIDTIIYPKTKLFEMFGDLFKQLWDPSNTLNILNYKTSVILQ